MAKKKREKAYLIHIRGANLLPLGPVVSGQQGCGTMSTWLLGSSDVGQGVRGYWAMVMKVAHLMATRK